MRLLRALFVLLLCMVLPITGLAASGLVGPCLTQMGMQDAHDDAQMNTMPECETMKSSQDSSKSKSPLCKLSVQCQLGSLYHPTPNVDLAHPAGLAISVVFFYVHPLIVREPGGFWRPPRSL